LFAILLNYVLDIPRQASTRRRWLYSSASQYAAAVAVFLGKPVRGGGGCIASVSGVILGYF